MRKWTMDELNRMDVAAFKAAPKSNIVLVLDNIRSRNNVGAIFRTADAFRVSEIVLCGITPIPPHKDIQKTALGSTDAVDWSYAKDTTEAMYYITEDLVGDDYVIGSGEGKSKSTDRNRWRVEGLRVLRMFW